MRFWFSWLPIPGAIRPRFAKWKRTPGIPRQPLEIEPVSNFDSEAIGEFGGGLSGSLIQNRVDAQLFGSCNVLRTVIQEHGLLRLYAEAANTMFVNLAIRL